MMVMIYFEQLKLIDVNSILDKGGYKGNSAIFRPNLVSNLSSSSVER